MRGHVRLTTGLLAAGLMAAGLLVPGSATAARVFTARPVTGHVTSARAQATRVPATTPDLRSAAAPPEDIPRVAPGASPAGYLPLDQFGIAATPVGDEEFDTVTTPPFVFADRTYTSLAISSNGFAKAGSATAADQNCCTLPTGPDPAAPNTIMAPFWTDLNGTGAPGVFTGTLTDGVSSWFVVEWRVDVFGTPSQRTFELWLGLNGPEDVSFAYDPTDLPAAPGAQPFLVGAENSVGQGDMSATLPTTDLRVSSVPALAQTITFTSTPPRHPALGSTYAVSATGGASGNPVTLSATKASAGVCTVEDHGDGTALVTFTGAGTCVIAAHQAGDNTYAKAKLARQRVRVVIR